MGATILVVEDEALIGDDIQRTLIRLGYEAPLAAATGHEGIDAVATMRPRLVLMDIKLQGPMDGIEAARVIRRDYDVPVVYLTSHSDDATLARAMEAAPYGYVLKPFSDRDLRTAIEVALHKHEVETRLAERERWLSTILLSIGDAVIVTDTSEVITVMNTVAETLTGWKCGTAIGRSLGEVFRLIDSAEKSAYSLAEGPLLVRKDGSMLPVAETRAAIRDRHGGVGGAVLVFRDMTKERAEKQRLGALVLLDPLTGIANRRALELRLSQELTRSRRYNRPLSCLMADIDTFKSINDHHGHTLGDSVLALVAQLFPRETRAEVDLVARYGGEEFVVILPETPLAGAIVTAERLRAKVASAWIAPRGLQVTVSIGVATGATEDLIVRADRAMYLAKRNGRNRVEVWDETTCGPLAVGVVPS